MALVQDGEILEEEDSKEVRKHSEEIGASITSLLEGRQSTIKAVAISSGPGSYTGLRIASSIAKGLCFGFDIPLIAVATPEATLMDLDRSKWTENMIGVFPSRKGEIYGSIVTHSNGIPLASISEALEIASLNDWLKKNNLGDVTLFGPGCELLTELQISSCLGKHSDVTSRGRSVAQLGELRLNNGLFEDIRSYQPQYLKPFVAKKAMPIFERLKENRKTERRTK